GELEQTWRHREPLLPRRHAGEALAHADRLRQVLVAQIAELRFVIEQIQLRRRARLEQVDHTLRLRRMVRQCQAARGFARFAGAGSRLSGRTFSPAQTMWTAFRGFGSSFSRNIPTSITSKYSRSAGRTAARAFATSVRRSKMSTSLVVRTAAGSLLATHRATA